MALPSFPDTEAALIEGTTNDDMINGGHKTLFFPLLIAALAMAEYAQGAGIEIETLAEQVALDAAAAAEGSGTEVTIEQIWAGAAAEYLSIRRALAAQARQEIAFAAPVAWDISTGVNFFLTLTGNTTVANATGAIAGKSGFLDVYQDGTGGHDVTAWGANFKWIGGLPFIATGPGRLTKIAYYVASPTEIHLSFAGNDAEPA